MPGTHPDKHEKYKKDPEENLKRALLDITNNDKSIKKASKDYGIPRSTLSDAFHRTGSKPSERKTVLTAKEENLLVEWIKESGRRGFGKTCDQICEAVKQVLDKAGRKIEMFKDNGPGKSWWWGFKRRHPDLHMLRPRPLELARAQACSKDVVFTWFDAFEKFLQEHNITSSDQIFNCDESGFPLQSCSPKKVCIDKVMKRSFHFANSSKTSITTLVCICANGSVIPPAVYFPGKKLNPEYCIGFPRNVFLAFSDSGWMETYHFYGWMVNHFVKRIPPLRPVVLLIDGHVSHLDYNTSVFCRDNEILLYRLPPHTLHVLQPADRGFFGVLKSQWKNCCSKFVFQHPGVTVTKRTFAPVFMEAYDKTARPEVVKSSFKSSGIWPVNRHAIDTSHFAPSKVFKGKEITKSKDMVKAKDDNKEASQLNDSTSSANKEPPDNRHPIHKSIEQIEQIAGKERVRRFETRLQEGYNIEEDTMYEVWKKLKAKKMEIDEHVKNSSKSVLSTTEKDLCPIMESILTYPELPKTEKKARKKIVLPRHMSSEAALKVLEIQDAEKRRKAILKECARNRKEEREKSKAKKNTKEKITEIEKKESRKRKSINEKEDSKRKKGLVYCGECEEVYSEDENWVQCDDCRLWYHINCTNLRYFDLAEIEEKEWSCFHCE